MKREVNGTDLQPAAPQPHILFRYSAQARHSECRIVGLPPSILALPVGVAMTVKDSTAIDFEFMYELPYRTVYLLLRT